MPVAKIANRNRCLIPTVAHAQPNGSATLPVVDRHGRKVSVSISRNVNIASFNHFSPPPLRIQANSIHRNPPG